MRKKDKERQMVEEVEEEEEERGREIEEEKEERKGETERGGRDREGRRRVYPAQMFLKVCYYLPIEMTHLGSGI